MSVNLRLRMDLVWAAVSIALACLSASAAAAEARWEDAAYFALHLQAAVLFAIRRPAVRRPIAPAHYVVPIACLLYPYLYDVSGDRPLGTSLILGGCVLCFFSTWSLGRSYAVLPAFRELKVSGPYRIVRHPIYASYLVMDLGMLMNAPTLRNIAVAAIGLVLFVRRIALEEHLLATFAGSESYRANVRSKLLPGIY